MLDLKQIRPPNKIIFTEEERSQVFNTIEQSRSRRDKSSRKKRTTPPKGIREVKDGLEDTLTLPKLLVRVFVVVLAAVAGTLGVALFLLGWY